MTQLFAAEFMGKAAIGLGTLAVPMLFLCAMVAKRRLKAALPEEGAPEIPKQLRQFYVEPILGVVIVFAVLFFARICLTGTASWNVAVGAAYLATLLDGLGSFFRNNKALESLGLPQLHERGIRLWLGAFSVGIFFFLVSLLTGALAIAQLVQQQSA